jgi:hypothetical protein
VTAEQILIAGISGLVVGLGAMAAALKVVWEAYQRQTESIVHDTVDIVQRVTESNIALKGAIDVLSAKLGK